MKFKEMVLKYKLELVLFSIFLVILICIRIVIPIALRLLLGLTWFDWVKYFLTFMVLAYLQLFLGFVRTHPIYYRFSPMIVLSVSGLNRIHGLVIEKIKISSNNESRKIGKI